MLTIVTAVQGQAADALPLFDQALTVTQADPALTDLRLLLQINQAITLGDLNRHEEAFAATRQARELADRVGSSDHSHWLAASTASRPARQRRRWPC